MKTSKKILLSAATLAACSYMAEIEAQAATDTMVMKAKIIAPVKITATQSLNFGTITYTAAGTVSVDQTNARAKTGGVSLVGGATGQRGQFTLKGATGVAIQVTAPATETVNKGGSSLDVKSFTFSGASKLTHSLTAVTETGFKVGATLHVTAAAPTGQYSGAVTLTAIYQ